jgi:methylmalonyl-CoA/ethylmalonyl-CoA epimerase
MRLVQTAMYAEDLSRARDFYAALLGSDPLAEFPHPGLLFFDLAGVRLLLDSKAPHSMLYLEVDDVRTAVRSLPQGAQVVTEPHSIFRHEDDTLGPAGYEEWQAFLTDTEGNTVGLVSLHPPEPGSN